MNRLPSVSAPFFSIIILFSPYCRCWREMRRIAEYERKSKNKTFINADKERIMQKNIKTDELRDERKITL